jgi:WD40 repeat protein
LLTISLAGNVYYLDQANPNAPKQVVRGHNKFITALAYDAQSHSIYSCSYDALIVHWSEETGATQEFKGKGHTNQIVRAFVQGDKLVTAALDDTIRITATGSREYSSESAKLDSPPADIAVGRKDTNLVLAVTAKSIVVLRGGKVAGVTEVKFQPTSIALSIDESKVAVGGKDNIIRLFTLSGDKLTESAQLTGHRGPLTRLAYSPDGQHLASADHNRHIFVWDLSNNSIKVQGWCFHTAAVRDLSWSPDSLYLVSASLDGALYVWSVQNPGKRIFFKDAHPGGSNCALWIDNQTVLSAGQDCCVKTFTVTHA